LACDHDGAFTSSAFAYPHEAFRIVDGLAEDRFDGPAWAIFAPHVIELTVASHDITAKHWGRRAASIADSAASVIVRPRLPATTPSASA
jgi:hypothetical protein